METIKQLIQNGRLDEAIRQLDLYIHEHPHSDEAYFLRGKAYQKQGSLGLALNNYLNAIALNPDSPAQQAHDMLINILNFYNKDMYNH